MITSQLRSSCYNPPLKAIQSFSVAMPIIAAAAWAGRCAAHTFAPCTQAIAASEASTRACDRTGVESRTAALYLKIWGKSAVLSIVVWIGVCRHPSVSKPIMHTYCAIPFRVLSIKLNDLYLAPNKHTITARIAMKLHSSAQSLTIANQG